MGDVAQAGADVASDIHYDFGEVFAGHMVPDGQFADAAEPIDSQLEPLFGIAWIRHNVSPSVWWSIRGIDDLRLRQYHPIYIGLSTDLSTVGSLGFAHKLWKLFLREP